MNYRFTTEDIKQISAILGITAADYGNSYAWNLKAENGKQGIALSIHCDVEFDDEKIGSLVSVQTLHGYYELHSCTAFMTFEPDEAIFLSEENGKVNCLIIGQNGACSMFSNIRRELLNADFTALDAPLLLSAMQLSITESLLEHE
jgi:hypothetical protein